MDKSILEKWLKAGYIEKTAFNPTFEGTPQGGIISPTLLVLTLTGLEQAVKAATGAKDKVNIIVYADDFIITGASREILESKVKPAVTSLLKLRALTLSEEKTHLTHVNDGVTSHLDLAEAAKVKIRRHLKIKGSANPYELAYDDYFDNRSGMNKGRHISIVRDERCQSTF